MKTALSCIAAAFVIALAASPGQAAGPAPYKTMGPYPWCADYNNMSGDCGFSSFEQCMQAASGNGNTCMPNPRYVPHETEHHARSPVHSR